MAAAPVKPKQRICIVADQLCTGLPPEPTTTASPSQTGGATSEEPLLPGWVVIDDGVIVAVGNGKTLPAAYSETSTAHTALSADSCVRYATGLLCPGFIDIHNHGIGGSNSVCEYYLSDATARELPKFGVTSFLASLTFPANNQPLTDRVIASVEQQSSQFHAPPTGLARVGGIHAEGPCVATLGGLPPSDAGMSLHTFETMLDTMPSLRVMTISPSLEAALGTAATPAASAATAASAPAASKPATASVSAASVTADMVRKPYERIRALLKRGVTPAIGHDLNANEQHIVGALRVGSEYKQQLHITHCFNVSSFHHRNVSLCNFGLLSRLPPGLGPDYAGLVVPTIEVIADLVHVHPLALTHSLTCKPSADVALVSDAIMSATDSSAKEYSGRMIEVCCGPACAPTPTPSSAASDEGKTKQSATGASDAKSAAKRVVVKGSDLLYGGCGSSLSMFHNAVNVCGVSIARAVAMCTSTPARIAHLDGAQGPASGGAAAASSATRRGVGRLAAGYHGDVLLFRNLQTLELDKVFIGGKLVTDNHCAAPASASAAPASAAVGSSGINFVEAQSTNLTRKDHTAAQIAANENALASLKAASGSGGSAGSAALAPTSAADSKIHVSVEINALVSVRRGDITALKDVHALVNAANETLEGGGGVDGAIHAAAGPGLRNECLKLPLKPLTRSTVVDVGRCDVGEAVVTGGHKLPAKHVIHTVAPLLDKKTGAPNSVALQQCYDSVLQCVNGKTIRSVAFCCIGTGFYAYPMEQAARMALSRARAWLESAANRANCDRLVFVVWNQTEYEMYQLLLPQYFPTK